MKLPVGQGISNMMNMKGPWELALMSLMPLCTNLWWYMTSYAIFLLFLPFLQEGIRKIGQKAHGSLAAVMLVIWGFAGMLYWPQMQFNLTWSNVFVFIYWFVLISYYKWYMKEFSKSTLWKMIGVSLTVEFVYWAGFSLLFEATGKYADGQKFIFDQFKLPTMVIGFAIFLLVKDVHFYSRAVNWIAQSAVSVFLIHFYPPVYVWWTQQLFPLHEMYASQFPILSVLGVVALVWATCLVLDMVRHVIFQFTFDRNTGALFDRVYAAIARAWERSKDKRAARAQAASEHGSEVTNGQVPIADAA
ncbi:symporter [Bifidobacterium dolichotidis]|uniref:Symporter n=2 Tax=Bifidobacterium dolichotidis TaxID=2306976 RepID=A0A430FRM9_9BIFI|nr:symporter [Bifidobacterium dolichotidis]